VGVHDWVLAVVDAGGVAVEGVLVVVGGGAVLTGSDRAAEVVYAARVVVVGVEGSVVIVGAEAKLTGSAGASALVRPGAADVVGAAAADVVGAGVA
jgi:hypothetical protein